MNDSYDVVVVGAGNGGLCAAAYAARAGQKTLLLEKNNTPGGCASSFRRGRFEFETALHELCQYGPKEDPGQIRKMFEELGLDIEMCPVKDCFRAVNPGNDKVHPYDVVMPHGRQNFVAVLDQVDPGCKEKATAFISLCGRAEEFLDYFTSTDGHPDEKVLYTDFADVLPYADKTVEEVLTMMGEFETAKSILRTYWSYLAVPTDEMEFVNYASMLIEYIDRQAYIPKLRSHGMSMAFDQRIRDFGGEIWYNTPVDEILVRDHKAYGVRIGERVITAKKVIADINPNVVYGKMIQESEVPDKAVKLSNARDLGVTAITVYYGLNRSAKELGITDYSRFVNMGTPREVFERIKTFNPRMIGGAMNCMNIPIPDYSPEGTCVLWGTTLLRPGAFDNVKPMEYEKMKQGIAYGFATFYKMTSGIDILPYIEEVEVATPVTFARYLGTPEGAIYGYQGHRWDNMMPRMMAKEDENYIGNLIFCGGHDTWLDGYNSSYQTGRKAGKTAAREIMEERK